MADEIERDPNVFIIGKYIVIAILTGLGEEVAQYQGAYKVTKGNYLSCKLWYKLSRSLRQIRWLKSLGYSHYRSWY